MTRTTRPISWISGARKEFEKFPEGGQSICLSALTIAAEGGKADIAKPMKGFGSGVFEIALPYRSNAFRGLCRADGRRYLGSSYLPEESDARHQDPEGRH